MHLLLKSHVNDYQTVMGKSKIPILHKNFTSFILKSEIPWPNPNPKSKPQIPISKLKIPINSKSQFFHKYINMNYNLYNREGNKQWWALNYFYSSWSDRLSSHVYILINHWITTNTTGSYCLKNHQTCSKSDHLYIICSKCLPPARI